MPAGDEQQQIREEDAIGQARSQRVAFEMVDGDERLAGGPGDPLRRHRADDQPADQAGTGGSRDAIDLGEVDASLAERQRHQGIEMVEMRPRGDLRHDPAIGRVLGQLGVDQVRPDLRARRWRRDNRSRRLVAAGFEAEDDHRTRGAVRPRQNLSWLGDFVSLQRLVGGRVDFEELDRIAPQNRHVTQHGAAALFGEKHAVMHIMHKN